MGMFNVIDAITGLPILENDEVRMFSFHSNTALSGMTDFNELYRYYIREYYGKYDNYGWIKKETRDHNAGYCVFIKNSVANKIFDGNNAIDERYIESIRSAIVEELLLDSLNANVKVSVTKELLECSEYLREFKRNIVTMNDIPIAYLKFIKFGFNNFCHLWDFAYKVNRDLFNNDQFYTQIVNMKELRKLKSLINAEFKELLDKV